MTAPSSDAHASRSPTSFDLALAIVILRSQPPTLTTRKYLALLRSLSSGNDDDVLGSRRGGHTSSVNNRLLQKLLDFSEESNEELKAKLLEVERERDALRAKLGGGNVGCSQVVGCFAPEDPHAGTGRIAATTQKPALTSVHASKLGVGIDDDGLLAAELSVWSPQILNSVKVLRLASTPEPISCSVQGLCHALLRIVGNICEGDGMQCASNSCVARSCGIPPKNAQLPDVGAHRTLISRPAEKIQALLRVTCGELLTALDKIAFLQGSHGPSGSTSQQNIGSESDCLCQAVYRFTQLMTGIVLAIHKNTMQRLHLICQVGPSAQSPNSRDAPAQSKKGTSGAGKQKQSAILKTIQKAPIVQEGSDVRPELTKVMIHLINSLRPHVKHERTMIEAIAFSLMRAFGTHIVKQPIPHTWEHAEPNKHGPKKHKGMNRRNHDSNRTDEAERKSIIEDLTREETAWFWLEILDCALQRLSTCEGSEGVVHGAQGVDGKSKTIDSLRIKLRETLFESAFGSKQLGSRDHVSGSGVSDPQFPAEVKLVNLPVLHELWSVAGFDSSF